MSPARLAPLFDGDPHEAVVFHKVTKSVDKYGDATSTSVDVAARGLFEPEHSVETEAGLSAGVTAPAALYLDDAQPVPGADWTVTARGVLWRVMGDPEVWSGAGTVVHLERFGGAPSGSR